jgi:hypothetical protein
LRHKERELFLKYYGQEGDQAGIRARLAASEDLTPGALSMRVTRIRDKLNRCCRDRLQGAE